MDRLGNHLVEVTQARNGEVREEIERRKVKEQ